MLRNVLLVSSSGLVLFAKDFVNAIRQPRLIGSLITAMIEFSTRTTGLPVSHIELESVAVTIVGSDNGKLFCALFHDCDDGYDFGKIMAREFVNAFLEDYAQELSSTGHNLKDFHNFTFRISEVIKRCIKPILLRLQQQRGIQKAILVTDESVTHATSDVDQLGVLANLQALLGLSADLMAFAGDNLSTVMLDGGRSTRILVWRVQRSTLVVAAKRSIAESKCRAIVQDSAGLLEKGL